jgi:hypothetical protein
MKCEPLQKINKTPKSSLESVEVACVQNSLQNYQKLAFCKDIFCIWACRTIHTINIRHKKESNEEMIKPALHVKKKMCKSSSFYFIWFVCQQN